MVEERVVGETRADVAGRIETLGWGLFFVWVGVALLVDVGWGIGLLGVGGITLAGQAARLAYGLRPEGFWAVAGCLFVIAGVWERFEIAAPLLPFLLIAAGVALLSGLIGGKALAGKSRS